MREEYEPGAVRARGGQREGHGLTEKCMRRLDQNAGAVAGIGFAAARAAMFQIDQDLEGVADNRMRALSLDVHDEADATGVVFRAWVIEALRGVCAPLIRVEHGRNIVKGQPP